MIIIFIIIFVIGIVALFAYIFFIAKRNAHVAKIRSHYPLQVSALCGTDVRITSNAIKKKILSFDNEYWDDWKNKLESLYSISNKYADVISKYILSYFPYVKNTSHYKLIKIFDPAATRCRILIECLQYDDILKLVQISTDEWDKRNDIRIKAETITLSNPDALKELRIKDSNLTDNDIVRYQKRIEQIQLRYTVASAFDVWKSTQKEFNALVRNLRDEHAKNCGCYTYNVEFQKPLPSGKTCSEKVSVWQIFPESISPYLKEFHSSLSFSMTQNIPEFKNRQRYFNNIVYDRIIPYINAIANDKKVLVIFNNRTSYNWELQTYTYHYRYLKSILKSNNIAYIDFDNLPTLIDSFQFDIVFVFDFITINSDLIYTSKLIIESFSTKIPNIVWYSMIKEFDEAEMKVLCADAINNSSLKFSS